MPANENKSPLEDKCVTRRSFFAAAAGTAALAANPSKTAYARPSAPSASTLKRLRSPRRLSGGHKAHRR